jgi:DNA-binding MarR family transcriptional regulator
MLNCMSPDHPAPRDSSSAKNRTAIGQALFGLAGSAVRHGLRDMSLTAASTLSTLNRTGPRRITDLAAVEGVTQPSMTALVSALERSGLVERRNDPADKRVVLVTLTTSGSNYVRARRRAGADAFVQLIDKLPAEEYEALAAAFTALEHLLELDEEERKPAILSTTDKRSTGGGL